jgi:hypothetical protein
MAEEKQDGQKTLVAFVVGLLIGGMLVWAFSGPSADAPVKEVVEDDTEVVEETSTETDPEPSASEETVVADTPILELGEGSVSVQDQEAGISISLEGATYPVSEGWIGVREYDNDNLGYILGVVRFSEAANLVPAEIILQRSTTAGRHYAVVIFTEDGDSVFNLATDVQIDQVFGTFTAK